MYKNAEPKIGISFSPYGKTYGRYGENKFLKLKEFGFSAADYNISDIESELYSLVDEELADKILDEKESAHRSEIRISQVHGPWRYPPQDSTEPERHDWLDKMKRAVVICSYLECQYLVVHPIMPYGTRDLDSGREQDTWNLNMEFFKQLVEFAKQYDVTVCLENMPMLRFSLAKPKQLLDFVTAFNSENLKICFDTGHAAVFPELSVGDEVRRLKNYIKVLHIHDNMGDRDSHLWPTKGIIDWPDFINALKEIGFSGVFSLETAPSGNSDDEQFEVESKELCKTVKNLLHITTY